MAQPPDIKYRRIIINDQENIDELLEDEDLHFAERCLYYQAQDVVTEQEIFNEYETWTEYMFEDAKKSGNQARKRFFKNFYDVVAEDGHIVEAERDKLRGEAYKRIRQRAAQRLGIPADHKEWTNEDRLRFYEDDEEVWGPPLDERYRHWTAQSLSIAENHEDWTDEDRLRVYEQHGWVPHGWPTFERGRHQAAQRLRIPANHEEWTNEDRLRFYEEDEWVEGWPNLERTRHQAAQRLAISKNDEEWTTEDKPRYVESDVNLRVWPDIYPWPDKDDLREELEKIDQEVLPRSLKDEQEAQSEDENEPATVNDERSTMNPPDLRLDDVDDGEDEAPAPSSDSAELLFKPEIKEDGINAFNDSELEANTTDDQSSSSLVINFRLGREDRYYRPLAAILLIFLIVEVVKQQLRL